jgi:hypothetical protein
MTEDTDPKHIPHKGKNIAYHIEWGFRREAAVWIDKRPVGPNFYPLGTELRNWMLRQGNLRYFSAKDKLLPHAFTNPYTYDGSVLAITYAQVINDSADFVKATEPLDPLEAEIRRIRLYTENVLYTARLSEAFIKQLLFCTTFDEGDYRGSALGSLLSRDCSGCRSSKDKRHKISLLGSLAHRYHLCHAYEGCLNEHMKIANRRRDIEAAHSGIAKFTPKAISAVRKQLGKDLSKIGDDFVHMLQHIGDIESRMLAELNPMIAAGAESVCPVVKAFKKGASSANAS